ncbi:methylated-DNA--[protein]-cysteine S-methyltransferase [Limimaricola sp.]|uniref:methylated-DNA--[protein]-cysteine S-methyltransferase n=1 Tax=Limimaricola sp. TaxID=2211665 RepID=UPI0025C6A8D9|nr:methylated-DNA--[protein]-cysteine S-methyltransferase [Limimaricola sp.]
MKAHLDTPFGPFWAEVREGAVVAAGWGACAEAGQDPVLDAALAQLAAYFDGKLEAFDLPLAPVGGAFQQAVWQQISAIPFGFTRTYGDLAKLTGGSAQAVGQACGANPIPVIIPCHRVLGTCGLGGYSGGRGIETKVQLLRLESAGGLLI